MLRFTITLGALVVLGANSTDQEESLAAPFASLLAGSIVESVKSVSDLPKSVSDALDANGTFPMVDPGEYWNPSCNRDSSNPEPDRSLIVAALSPRLVGGHYERGGVSRHSALELFELDASGRVLTRCLYRSSTVADSVAALGSAFPRAFKYFHCKPAASYTPAAQQAVEPDVE